MQTSEELLDDLLNEKAMNFARFEKEAPSTVDEIKLEAHKIVKGKKTIGKNEDEKSIRREIDNLCNSFLGKDKDATQFERT